METLKRLAAFVASHDMMAVHIDDGQVVFGVQFALNGEPCQYWEWVRVSTFAEARDALGY